MSSTFFGLEIGKRALDASQLALNVVGQNTANVNTPGYSRQVVQFTATDPFTPPDFEHGHPGNLGTGVTISAVNRIRDAFTDKRVFGANAEQGSLGNLSDILSRVESAYNEPSDSGLGHLASNFFHSFADLSANPESGAIRATVRNQAETLVGAFHSVSTALDQIGPDITAKVAVKIGDANTLAGQIATLNNQIRTAIGAGDQPNDLLDKRGALINTLSGIVDVQVTDGRNAQTGKPNGEVEINVGGYALVQGDQSSPLPTTVTTTNGAIGLTTPSGDTIPLRGGEVYGLAKASALVAGYKSDLNTLASSFISAVNTQHATGYGLDGVTGRAFFSGTDAQSISVDSVIKTDLNAIAAASAPIPPATFAAGNGDNARALAALDSAPVINGFSLNAYYNAGVARIGADSRSAQTAGQNQEKVLSQLQAQQASVSGVSLDEELTRMLQYQRTYQAASRVINVMDDIVGRIINNLGIPGSA